MSLDYAIRVLVEKSIFLQLILHGGLDYKFTGHEIEEIHKDTLQLQKAIEILRKEQADGKRTK